MNIKAETNYYEIIYLHDGRAYTTNLDAGVVDDTAVVLKWFRTKYKCAEVRQISKLAL